MAEVVSLRKRVGRFEIRFYDWESSKQPASFRVFEDEVFMFSADTLVKAVSWAELRS